VHAFNCCICRPSRDTELYIGKMDMKLSRMKYILLHQIMPSKRKYLSFIVTCGNWQHISKSTIQESFRVTFWQIQHPQPIKQRLPTFFEVGTPFIKRLTFVIPRFRTKCRNHKNSLIMQNLHFINTVTTRNTQACWHHDGKTLSRAV